MNVKAIAIIPSRFASTRFPGKPLVVIKGMTLLERTYRRVLLCPDISRIIIATDDARIEACARSFGAEVVMTSTSCATGTDRLAEVVQKDAELLQASALINIQGDEPCIDPKNISHVLSALLSNPSASISTIIAPIHRTEDLYNPNIVKCVKTLTGRALYFSRHVIPGSKSPIDSKKIFEYTYFRHIGMYAYRPQFVLTFANLPATPLQQVEDLEMLRAMEHGYEVQVAEVERHSPDVNTPEDIKEVIQWIEHQSTCS